MTQKSVTVALLVGSLSGGGQSTNQVNLAGALARLGHRVDLLFFHSPGPDPERVPPDVNVVDLRTECGWWHLCCFLAANPTSLTLLIWHVLVTPRLLVRPYPGASRMWIMLRLLMLVRYVCQSQPAVIYARGDRANLLALWARRLAGGGTHVVVTHCNIMAEHLRINTERTSAWRARFALGLMSRAFLRADAIVSPSDGVRDEMSRTARIPRKRITTIYNPVVSRELWELAQAPLDDPWFRPGAPAVILGAGWLVDQKDFPMLLRAFARVRRQRTARLVILGEGEHRSDLEALAEELDVAKDVALQGYVSNPFAWMSRASVFALSSKWEGLPTVLIEAMACGCPVVSTDCPSGPAEILDGGEYGRLVPVGDDAALAAALIATLNNPPPRERLIARGRWFTVERAAERYVQFIPGELDT